MDSTSGHKTLSFLGTFSKYNQIRMASEDEKTAFITNQGLYCYKVISFGLKNAKATYQRLINKVFSDQIGCNIKVYVDNMLMKRCKERQHMADLETF